MQYIETQHAQCDKSMGYLNFIYKGDINTSWQIFNFL